MNTENGFELTIQNITEKVNFSSNEYVCLNDLLKFFPTKRMDVWLKLLTTKDFIKVVEKTLNENYDPTNQWYHKSAIFTIKGKGKKQGTYAHELVALEFLSWLSSEFKVLVFTQWNEQRKKSSDQSNQVILTKEAFQEMLQAGLREFTKKFATKKELQAIEDDLEDFARGLDKLLFQPIFERLEKIEANQSRMEANQRKMDAKLLELNPPQYGFVYVLHNPVNNEYKIGQSNQPDIRSKAFKSLDPRIEVQMILSFESVKQAMAMEKFLHHQFETKRTHGEWFCLDAIDLSFIENLKEAITN